VFKKLCLFVLVTLLPLRVIADLNGCNTSCSPDGVGGTVCSTNCPQRSQGGFWGGYNQAQSQRLQNQLMQQKLEMQKLEMQRQKEEYEYQQRIKNENINAYKINALRNQNIEKTKTQEQTDLENKLIESTAKAQALQQQLNEIKEKDIANQKAQSTCKELGFKLGSSKYLKCIDKLTESKTLSTNIKTESAGLLNEKSKLPPSEPEIIISSEPVYLSQAKSQCERLSGRLASTQEVLNLYKAKKVSNLNWVWTSNKTELSDRMIYMIFNTTSGEEGSVYASKDGGSHFEPLHFICIK
jgi:hypothetical protein